MIFTTSGEQVCLGMCASRNLFNKIPFCKTVCKKAFMMRKTPNNLKSHSLKNFKKILFRIHSHHKFYIPGVVHCVLAVYLSVFLFHIHILHRNKIKSKLN